MAQPAQLAGDLLHEAGQMFPSAGQRHGSEFSEDS